MVTELSAETYDWERFKNRGDDYVELLERLHELSPSVDRMADNPVLPTEEYSELIADVRSAIVDSLGDENPLIESTVEEESCVIFQTPPPKHSSEHTFRISIWVSNTDDCRLPLDAEFTVVPHATEQEDTRYPIRSSGGISSDDVAHARNTIEYLFKIKREAMELASNTLFSQREAEVVLIDRNLSVSDEEVCELMDSTQSNLSVYRGRIEEKEEKAEKQMEAAYRTIELLS